MKKAVACFFGWLLYSLIPVCLMVFAWRVVMPEPCCLFSFRLWGGWFLVCLAVYLMARPMVLKERRKHSPKTCENCAHWVPWSENPEYGGDCPVILRAVNAYNMDGGADTIETERNFYCSEHQMKEGRQ